MRKILKRFFGLCAGAGFILWVGTVGRDELTSMELKEFFTYTLICIVLMSVGFIGLKVIGSDNE